MNPYTGGLMLIASDEPGAWTCKACGFRGFWRGGLHCASVCEDCKGSGEGRPVFNGYMDVPTACRTCDGTGFATPE